MINEHDIIEQAKASLESILKSVPFLHNNAIRKTELKNGEFSWGLPLMPGKRIEFIKTVYVDSKEIKLLCEIKKNLQPRFVLDAIREAENISKYISGEAVYPVVASEYISPRSAEIFKERKISYFDLTGNCRLCFDNVYIEREGVKPKSSEQRGVKSLFGLKSSRMLRLLLSEPIRTSRGDSNDWPIKHLAAKTKLSYGQVSNIRRALINQDYALESPDGGFHLSKPDELLNEWQSIYKKNIVKQERSFYSILNAEEKHNAIISAIEEADSKGAGVMLNGLSAARWLSPFVRTSTESFYADKQGFEILKKYLKLEAVNMGPNVIIDEPKDPFLFSEAIKCAPRLESTSAIQTYLDLFIAGEREQEAAEHIRSNIIKKIWNGTYEWKINE